MNKITLADLSLKDITLDSLPRLKRLRESHFNTQSEVCVELPLLMTEYMKKMDNPSDSSELRAARRLKAVLTKKKSLIREDDLLAGTTTTKIKGVVIYPQFMAQALWPELETLSIRKKNPYRINKAEIDTLNLDVFPYWMEGTVQEVCRKDYNNPKSLQMMERLVFFLCSKVHMISHTIPDYEVVVKEGLGSILKKVEEKESQAIRVEGKESQTDFYQTIRVEEKESQAIRMEEKESQADFYQTIRVEEKESQTDFYQAIRMEEKESQADFYQAIRVEEKESQTDFYQAIKMVIEGVIAYANNLSQTAASLAEIETNLERKNELLVMSKNLSRVPKEKPETFHEALQAIWLCQVALHQENNNIALSLGRVDQILYPFYRQDIEKGILTVAKAVELIGCFFLKLADHVPMVPETGEELFGGSGSNQAITLGGVNSDGEDAVNDLTYIMLRATELLKVRDPNVNARYYPGINPKEYLDRLCGVNITTKATPCFHNDKKVIDTLLAQSYSIEDAREYSIVGCVEPVRGGKTFGHTGAIMLNLTAALEMALFSGRDRLTEEEQFGPKTPLPSAISSFDQFLSAFKEQIIFLIDQSVELNNMFGKTHFKVNPLPLLSALTQGTIEKGKDVLCGGAVYNSSGVAIIGISEVVDSLCAIKEFVFDKKEVTFSELIVAIEKDWEGQEKLRLKIINSDTKYGTASQEAKEMTNFIIDLLHTEYQKRENYRGGRYTVGYWSMTTHAGWGVLTGAMPSGRRNKEVLPSGITPVSGQAPELTEVLRFMAELDSRKIANSYTLNLKYTPATGIIDKFAASIEAYMQMGGLQVQFNLIDRATLKDARDHPEKYPNLLVRVSGYTAYFADLNPYMKEEIITRAEYDLQTGKEVK